MLKKTAGMRKKFQIESDSLNSQNLLKKEKRVKEDVI